ncbi:hypothetical protein B0H34DRAFT_7954 [Crassisporium funariophilum]|nr:hypothetical protein B0H34DRAFT_7954 [Crassisporium funariophilum]
MYRVFLGAPSIADIQNDPSSYQWRTVSSKTTDSNFASIRLNQGTQSVIFPAATLEAASHRISLVYKNIIFNDGPDEESFAEQYPAREQPDESVVRGADQTSLITWLPTAPNETRNISRDANVTGPSFLLDLTSESSSDLVRNKSTLTSASQPQTQSVSQPESQDSQSFGNYSDASSIGRFPAFHFNLHTISSLSQLSGTGKFKGSKKVNLLLAVLEVEGPDTLRIKKGVDAGKEVAILKMILGDEEGTICKLTAWRDVAEEWGGSGEAVAAKRGDIVHIQNVMAACDPSTSTTLSASPYLKSQLTICYRSMPYTHEDNRLRPDLRLGESEPSVRKVAAVVCWFEHMAGLAPVT